MTRIRRGHRGEVEGRKGIGKDCKAVGRVWKGKDREGLEELRLGKGKDSD